MADIYTCPTHGAESFTRRKKTHPTIVYLAIWNVMMESLSHAPAHMCHKTHRAFSFDKQVKPYLARNQKRLCSIEDEKKASSSFCDVQSSYLLQCGVCKVAVDDGGRSQQKSYVLVPFYFKRMPPWKQSIRRLQSSNHVRVFCAHLSSLANYDIELPLDPPKRKRIIDYGDNESSESARHKDTCYIDKNDTSRQTTTPPVKQTRKRASISALHAQASVTSQPDATLIGELTARVTKLERLVQV